MPLTTLAEVKTLLRIPSQATGDDSALEAVINAAESAVLNLTGYVLVDTDFVEFFRNVVVGVPIRLRRRPVADVSCQWRVLGTDWQSVSHELLDAENGELVLLPATVWPPLLEGWALMPVEERLPYVKVSYTAKALPSVPAELHEAANALSVYWWGQVLSGSEVESRLDVLTRTTAQDAMPRNVISMLAAHIRPAGGVV